MIGTSCSGRPGAAAGSADQLAAEYVGGRGLLAVRLGRGRYGRDEPAAGFFKTSRGRRHEGHFKLDRPQRIARAGRPHHAHGAVMAVSRSPSTCRAPRRAGPWISIRPTRSAWIVPFGAGGGTDIQARIIAQEAGKVLGQTVVVENRPGAGGDIGAAFVAQSSRTANAAGRLHRHAWREPVPVSSCPTTP